MKKKIPDGKKKGRSVSPLVASAHTDDKLELSEKNDSFLSGQISPAPPRKSRNSPPKQFERKTNSKAKKDAADETELRALKQIKKALSKEHIEAREVTSALRAIKREATTVSQFLSLVKMGEDMRERYGMPYSSIISDYAEKLELIEKTTTKLDIIRKEKTDLELRISSLKALEHLQNLLSQQQSEADALVDYIEGYKDFVKLGFDLKTMTVMVDELVRLGFDPAESGGIIGSWLTKNRTIAEATLKAEQSLDAIKKEESLTISRIETLVKKVEEAQNKIDALESYYVSRSHSLEAEYESRQRALNTRMNEERRRAEAETFEILRQRDKLRNENRLLKEEDESVRKNLDAARSISSLIRNPQSLSSSQVETIILELSRAKANSGGKNSSLPKASERLMEARRLFLLALQETIDA